jgi:hypothetical protein
MASGGPSPIPFDELFEVTEATFLVAEAVASARPMETTGALPAIAFAGA